ncbi:MAG: hypothetical protein ACI8QU_001437 [Devosia litorisediminis]
MKGKVFRRLQAQGDCEMKNPRFNCDLRSYSTNSEKGEIEGRTEKPDI